MEDRLWQVAFSSRASGTMRLSERESLHDGVYRTTSLLDHAYDDVELGIGFNADPCYSEYMGFGISMNRSHMESPDTGRAFHVHFDVFLDRDDVQKLRDFCDLLLKIVPT